MRNCLDLNLATKLGRIRQRVDTGAHMHLGYVVSAVLDNVARAPQLLTAE